MGGHALIHLAPGVEAAVEAARAGADLAEARCCWAPDLVALAKEHGLLCLALPAGLGGLGLAPDAIVDVIERLAHADGAAGWCGFIGNATSFVGWLDPDVARSVSAGAPHIAAASIFSPSGQAVPDGRGGYRVDGRWSFASGCLHSERIQVGVVMHDDDGPRQRPDGLPDWRFAFLTADDLEVLDTWDTLGLRGTGSNDVVARGARVDADHLAMPMLDPPRCEDDIYRLGFWPLVNVLVTPFALGVARRALDELVAGLGGTTPAGPRPGRDDPEVLHRVGQARASLLGARALLDDAVGHAWAAVMRGDRLPEAEAERLSLAMHFGVRQALAIVDTCFDLAGSGVVRAGNPLGRCFRDLQTARKHVIFSPEGYRLAGRRALAGASAP